MRPSLYNFAPDPTRPGNDIIIKMEGWVGNARLVDDRTCVDEKGDKSLMT